MTAVTEAPVTVRSGQSGLRTMYWVFPDRESTRARPMYQAEFWGAYEEVAERLGMRWVSVPTDAIAVDNLDHGAPRVLVNGELATPADSLFVTALYSLPYQSMDVFNQYATYAVLEQLGFYLPAPPALSPVCNDKLATLLYFKDSPIPPIPTVRIGTGRDLGHKLHTAALERLTFPVIVKPTGWCAGWGICMASNAEDLRGILSLAQGGDTTMVCQPYLGDATSDYRVFIIDGEPIAVNHRIPQTGSYVANTGRGGNREFLPVPDELMAASRWFADKLRVPFLCVDFLFDGERYWFSEVELDGVIPCPDHNSTAARARQHELVAARFHAYAKAHAAHLTEVSA
jgi:glutathione synthase/RimK-type ligase-like ATP-grasp enzyme